jgi:hemolysin activation/secretion protein
MHCAAGLVLSILWSSAIFAGLVEVPAAVRPGALRPGEERQSVPQQPPPAVYEVPAIVERPLDIDAGAKIHVASFELLGATDQPEHEIVTKDVQSLMDAKLSSQGDGLTVGRIQEVADAVTQYYRTRGLILA